MSNKGTHHSWHPQIGSSRRQSTVSDETPSARRGSLISLKSIGSFFHESSKEDIYIAGEEVTVYNDIHFKRVREAFGVGPHMLGIDMFSFNSLRAGGGKGGSLMQFTNDQMLLVKQLSKDDVRSMLAYAEDYCNHVLSSPDGSLLSRFFYHFSRPKDGLHYVVMNNCMPAMRAVDALWDLKGCCDDKIVRQGGASVPQVHKRWYRVHWLAAEAFGDCAGIIPLGRKRYKLGKMRARSQQFELTEGDYRDVVRMVQSDVEFLKSCGLMDYSLIVGCLTEKISPGKVPTFPPGGFGGQPYIVRSGEWVLAYYIGIIDFLQFWSVGKQVAHVIKYLFAPKPISTIKPDDYAKQFLKANTERFKIVDNNEPPIEVRCEEVVFQKNPSYTQSSRDSRNSSVNSNDVRNHSRSGRRASLVVDDLRSGIDRKLSSGSARTGSAVSPTPGGATGNVDGSGQAAVQFSDVEIGVAPFIAVASISAGAEFESDRVASGPIELDKPPMC